MLSATLFVDADAGALGNGLAWASAYEDLESALEHAATLNSDGCGGRTISVRSGLPRERIHQVSS